jgi:hypothetical protein
VYAHWLDKYSKYKWAWKWIDEVSLRCVKQLRELAQDESQADRRLELLRESSTQMLDAFEMIWYDDPEGVMRFHNAAGRIIGVLEELEAEVLTAVFSIVSDIR